MALDAAEQPLFEHVNLNTAEAKHAGAVLLAHLRLIKANSDGVNRNQQLNEAGGHDWLTKTQAEMLTALTNPIADDQLAALREYRQAFEEVRDGGPNAANREVIARNLA